MDGEEQLIASAAPHASRLMVLMFTDIVGSTALKARCGAELYTRVIARHDQIFKAVIARIDGASVLQDTGDGFYASFATASDAVKAALAFQQAMAAQKWPARVAARVGIHIGEVAMLGPRGTARDGDAPKPVGIAVDLAARVMSLAQGGQVLMTRWPFNDARQFVSSYPPPLIANPSGAGNPVAERRSPPLKWMAHGPYLFKGEEEPVEVFEVGGEGVSPLAAPPDAEKARRAVRPGEEQTLGWRPAVGLALPDQPHWIVQRKLGEGGFGEVWLAEHAKTKSVRVFKFCFDPERLRALKREVVLFRLLKEALGDRRDTARILDFQFEKPPYFIEMEYTPDGNLADWAEARGGIDKVPLEERLDIVAKVAEAVAAAHSVGVLHKDIKPTNILMVRDAETGGHYPRLTDFGIGLLTDRTVLGQHNITMQGFTVTNIDGNESSRTGTRMYAPPEILTGKPFTTQGDVYALGVLLYQMVVADLNKPLAEGWERDVRSDLLREDIAACVEGDPQRRLVSAAELAQRLEKLPDREIELARRQQRERSARRRKLLYRVAVLAASFLAVILIVVLILMREANAQRHEAQRQRGEAERHSREADRHASESQRHAIEAQARLADSLIAQGDALGALWRWTDALRRYDDARAILVNLKQPVARAELGSWDAYRHSISPIFSTPSPLLYSATLAADGRTAVAANIDGTLNVWDVATGARVIDVGKSSGYTDVEHPDNSPASLKSVAFVPGTRLVIAGGRDQRLTCWDLADGREHWSFSPFLRSVQCVAVSADGGSALVGGAGGTLIQFEPKTGKIVATLSSAGSHINAIAHVPGKPLAAVTRWSTARIIVELWDLKAGSRLKELTAKGDLTMTTAVSPDGGMVVAGAQNGTLVAWELTSGREMWSIQAHGDDVRRALFTPDGAQIVTSGSDGTIKVWNASDGKLVRSMSGSGSAYQDLALSQDGRLLLFASPEGVRVQLFQPERGVRRLDGPLGIHHVDVSRNGLLLLTVETGGEVWLRDTATGRRLRRLIGAGDVPSNLHQRTVSFARDDTRAVYYHSGTIHTFDLVAGRGVGRKTLPARHRFLALSPNGERAVTRGDDARLHWWDVDTGTLLRTSSTDCGEAFAARYSPDGTRVMSVEQNDQILQIGSIKKHLGSKPAVCIWDVEKGDLLRRVPLPEGVVRAGEFSADGGWLYVPVGRSIIRVDSQTGAAAGLTAPGNHAVALAHCRGGEWLVIGGEDHVVRLWSNPGRAELRALRGHAGELQHVTASEDGQVVASCDVEKGRPATYNGLVWDFDWGRQVRDLIPMVESARATLHKEPMDGAALATLGRWFALRGLWEWGEQFLVQARANGAEVDPVILARCHAMSGRAGDARRELESAKGRSLVSASYLTQWINALAEE